MALGTAEVFALAQESLLVLVLDRHIRARAERVTRLETALAALLGAYQAETATREDRPFATRRLLDRMVEFLRSSEDIEEISAQTEVLRAKLRWVLVRHAERPGIARSRSSPGRSSGTPPWSSSGGPGSSGTPAEVRAWEVPRGENPPDSDPERKERPPGLAVAREEPDDGFDLD